MAAHASGDGRVAAECFPVGVFVREEMAARGWQPSHLAVLLLWDEGRVGEVLDGASITPLEAVSLAMVFDTSPGQWLNLQEQYERWREAWAAGPGGARG